MKDLRSVWFQDLEEIEEVNEIVVRKRKVVINRPFQVGIAVCQMAKLRILQFCYDCLDRYLDRRDFELMQMDTDSLSRETLEGAVRPEMREEFKYLKKKVINTLFYVESVGSDCPISRARGSCLNVRRILDRIGI